MTAVSPLQLREHDWEALGDGQHSKCRTCGWTVKASASVTKANCPGLPVYDWHGVPDGLFTARQLASKRLLPGEPRGLLYWSKAPDNYIRLYLASEAIPKAPLTPKQAAAIERLREANSAEGRERKRRTEVRGWARQVLALDFVVIDTETCDLWAGSGVIELAVVGRDGTVLFESRLNPGRLISPDAQAVHGISAEMLADCPTFRDVYPALAEAVGGKRWVGYNVVFDEDHVEAECRHYELPVLTAAGRPTDVMRAYAMWWGDWNGRRRDWKWQKLSTARYRHGLDVPGDSHSAASDALATLRLLEFLAKDESEQKMPAMENERE